MPSIKAYNPETGKWEIQASSHSSEISVIDIEDNFKSSNVEGCLRELANGASNTNATLDATKKNLDEIIEKINNGDITIGGGGTPGGGNEGGGGNTGGYIDPIIVQKVEALEKADKNFKSDLDYLSDNFTALEDRVQYLEENGGGGGGGAVSPTISCEDHEENATIYIDEGANFTINIFFKSPNLGEGKLFMIVNDIEIGSVPIKQGANTIDFGVLTEMRSKIQMYATDRVGMVSNTLTYNVVSGGLTVSVNFDSEADYAIDDDIRMFYTINAEIIEDLTLHIKVGVLDEEHIPARNGINEYRFNGLSIGVGVHKVSMYITSGTFSTKPMEFNLIIVNSENLFVSTLLEEGSSFEYGVPIQVPYRISKLSKEEFTVYLSINGVTTKTLKSPPGSYIWTIPELEVGAHKLKVHVISDQGEESFVERNIYVDYGSYVPVKPIESGLLAWFDATGRTNNDDNKEIWVDKSGNGVEAKLHNFNFFTNGWQGESLLCDGNAYVEIDMQPYISNVKLGSTIDILYKPTNIGFNEARILDYTDLDIPYKGVYINILEAAMQSLVTKTKVTIDEELETHVTFVIDRENKFAKVYIDGVVCAASYLTDSGAGVNKFYEDFSHNQKIYINSQKGKSNFGVCEVKQLRVYNRALTADEVLTNVIADIHDLREQEKIYKFNYENSSTPTIRMYGDFNGMSTTVSKSIRIKYTSPNEDVYGSSFDLPYCDVFWQGTSSAKYILKNFTAYLKDESGKPYMYSPYPNGIKENVFCFKCD